MMWVYLGWIWGFCIIFLTLLMAMDGAFSFSSFNQVKHFSRGEIIILYIVMYLLAPIFCVLLVLGDD